MRPIQDAVPRPTILLLHEFHLSRFLVKAVFEGDDYCILEAENGLQAVEMVSG